MHWAVQMREEGLGRVSELRDETKEMPLDLRAHYKVRFAVFPCSGKDGTLFAGQFEVETLR